MFGVSALGATVLSVAISVSLTIQGLNCASCVGRIGRAVQAAPGVTGVAGNLVIETAKVRFSQTLVSAVNVAEASTKAGYTAQVVTA